MRFEPTAIAGVRIVQTDPAADERGDFRRAWCAREFAAAGIDFAPVQANLSRNRRRGTLRGMHLQSVAAPEPKLVHCVAGRVHDVVIDLRRDSPTHRRWVAVELSADRGNALYIPAGCAHGFLTLTDEASVAYLMGGWFTPEAALGVRWNDPAFAIDWPDTPAVIAPRDAAWPDYRP